MLRRLLFRAAIKSCGIVIVTVDEIDGAVRLLRESNVADEWPSRKLTFHRGLEALAFQLGIEKLANADLRDDLVGVNFDLRLGWITAIAFTWNVLREVSTEPKIISQWNARTCVRVRTYEEDEQSDQQIDCFHYLPFSFRRLAQKALTRDRRAPLVSKPLPTRNADIAVNMPVCHDRTRRCPSISRWD